MEMFSNASVIPGYMDYDPKSAAIASRNSSKKRIKSGKWFDM